MKRHPSLIGLSREHHHALVLAVRTRRQAAQATPDMARELAHSFASEIEPHFQIEERLLLPPLRDLGGRSLALVQQTLADHAFLRAAAAQLARGDTAHVLPFAERLHTHVRFEERQLFEHAQAVLPDAVLQRIADASTAD